MKIEDIRLRLFNVVAKGLTHAHYKRTTDLHKEYLALVAGVGLDDKLRQFIRREDKALFDQRKNLTEHIVTSISKNLLDPFFKVPRSNSGRRVLNYTGEKTEAKSREMEKLLSKFWGEESWDDYMATRFPERASIDPNGLTVIEFKPFDHTKTRVAPYPYEVTSEMAVDYKKSNKILEYLIVKDSHSYRIEEDKIKRTLNEDALEPVKYKDGHKYTLYTKDQTFRLLQIDEPKSTILTSAKEGVVTKYKRKEYVKLKEIFYEWQTFAPHNCDQVPAVFNGHNRDLTNRGKTFVSPIHSVVPYLNKTITVNSHLDLVAALLAFPQLLKYAEECKAQNCYEGTNTVTNQACSKCKGLGLRATAPSAQDAIILRIPDSKEEAIPLDQIAKYLSPPVDIVQWQEEYIERLTQKAKRILYNSDTFDKKQVAETATGKTLDMQNVYDTLYPFALKFGKTWKKGVDIMAKLADLDDKLVSSYTFGKDFKMETLSTLIDTLAVANGIGSSALTGHLRDDIALIVFAEKPLEHKRYLLKQSLNPFAGKSDKEITMLMASNLVPKRDKVLYANESNILVELEIEYVKKKSDFYKLKRTEQREAVYKKVDELMELIDSETVPSLDLT